MRRQEFNELASFTAVAETKSFTKAAERLGLSTSGVSQTIRMLESRIGLRLFNRSTRSVVLTDAGQRFLEEVQPALRDLRAAFETVSDYRIKPTGRLKIMAQRLPSQLYLEPVLQRFLDLYPDIKLDITLDDNPSDPISAGFDGALRLGETIPKDLIAIKLGGELQLVVVGTKGYLKRFGRPETPQDLKKHRCINWRRPGHEGVHRWEFFDGSRWFDVAVDGPLTLNDRAAVANAAQSGIGLAQASEPLVRARVKRGTLVTVLDRWSGRFPGFYLCVPRLDQPSAALRVFIDFMKQAAQR